MSSPMAGYLDLIGRVPLLSAAEEITLGNQVQAGQQLQAELADRQPTGPERRTLRAAQRAKGRMVEANLRLVVSISRRYGGNGIDQIDLCQEGTLGLIRAVEKFDPARGYKFSTYAFWWIRQAMQRAVDSYSRTIRIPVQLGELHRRAAAIIHHQRATTGSAPSLAELAEALGHSVERVRDALVHAQDIASLDSRVRSQDGCELGELQRCTGPTPDEVLDRDTHREELILAVERGMSQMTEAQREVIARRFGLNGGEQETLAAIGAAMGVTRERVRQQESRAMAIIRRSASTARDLLAD